MKINFIPTPEFIREYKRLAKKYPSLKGDLKLFQEELIKKPDSGTELGGNIRKIRISIKSKNKGKSGGARIITYHVIASLIEKSIILIAIYDKSESETITDKAIKGILQSNGYI